MPRIDFNTDTAREEKLVSDGNSKIKNISDKVHFFNIKQSNEFSENNTYRGLDFLGLCTTDSSV